MCVKKDMVFLAVNWPPSECRKYEVEVSDQNGSIPLSPLQKKKYNIVYADKIMLLFIVYFYIMELKPGILPPP